MSVKTVRDVVRTHFETQWTALHPTYPVVDTGQPTFDPGVVLPWVKFLTGPSSERQRWMGAPRGFSQTGLFEFAVHVPIGPGKADGDLLELADEAASFFTGNTISGVRFEPEGQRGVRRGPLIDDGPWRICPVIVPYEYEFTKA